MVEAPSQQVRRARTGGSKALLRSFFGCRARNGRGESERVTGGVPDGPGTCPAVNRKLETVLVGARIAPTQPGRKPPRSVPDRIYGEDRCAQGVAGPSIPRTAGRGTATPAAAMPPGSASSTASRGRPARGGREGRRPARTDRPTLAPAPCSGRARRPPAGCR